MTTQPDILDILHAKQCYLKYLSRRGHAEARRKAGNTYSFAAVDAALVEIAEEQRIAAEKKAVADAPVEAARAARQAERDRAGRMFGDDPASRELYSEIYGNEGRSQRGETYGGDY